MYNEVDDVMINLNSFNGKNSDQIAKLISSMIRKTREYNLKSEYSIVIIELFDNNEVNIDINMIPLKKKRFMNIEGRSDERMLADTNFKDSIKAPRRIITSNSGNGEFNIELTVES